MRLVLSAAAQDIMLEAMARALEGGSITIYDRSPPMSADEAPTDQRALADLEFDNAKFADHQLNAALRDGIAKGSGKATWARIFDRHKVAVLDCDVGEVDSGAAIEMNTADIRKGGPVLIDSFRAGMGRRA
jgi:hypothetical protein